MHSLTPSPSERADALAHGCAPEAVDTFVSRQREALDRVARLKAFYGEFPSRTGVLHRLATAAIALSRFAALSQAYTEIGRLLMPVTDDGLPRTERWAHYVETHRDGRPPDIREEAWLAAHLEDMEDVKKAGLVEAFEAERAQHADDPAWAMLEEHMAVTLGTRVRDHEALDGQLALETALATSLSGVVRRMLRTGWLLVRLYVLTAARRTLLGGPRVPDGLPTDRQLVWILCECTANLVGLGRVWRIGRSRAARGVELPGAAWSLVPSLDEVLGADRYRLHKDVEHLFDRMHEWEMTAWVELDDRALFRVGARWATVLFGQGMYEQHLEEVPARFRLFRREDGSLHFVREFWCDDAVRVFDSDFVVRRVDRDIRLVEVFGDLGLAACMDTEVLDDGGLSMTIERLFVRGIARPVAPFRVCFTTRPGPDRTVDVLGVMDLAPRNVFERFWWKTVMRLPDRIGSIAYRAVRADRLPSPDSA